MTRPTLLLLSLGLVACADLEPIALDVCGNQVLEQGEDCDVLADEGLGPGTRCGGADAVDALRCRYVCDPATPCPLGWDCGGDGSCRRALDELAIGPTTLDWSPDTFALTDFDGDGITDVVGAFPEGIEFRRGDGAGLFADPHGVLTGPVTGAVATGRLDSDPFGDVLLPTSEGVLVFRGSELGRPLLAAYAGLVLAEQSARVLPLRNAAFVPEGLLLALVPIGPRLIGRLYTYENQRLYQDVDLGPSIDTTELEGQVAVGDLDDDGRDEVVFGIRGTREVHVYGVFQNPVNGELTLGGFGPSFDEPLEIELGVAIASGVRLADRDGDGHLDVLVGVAGSSREKVMVALGDGDLGLGEPHLDHGFDALAEADPEPGIPEGTPSAWPIAAADLDGDAVSDFVGQNGIFLADPDPPHDLRQTFPRRTLVPWTAALAVDVDGNGQRDVVAIASREPKVHVHLGVEEEDGTFAGRFAHHSFQTERGEVVKIDAGSLQGPGASDLVIVETAGEGDDRRDTLEVMFAQQGDWPTAPIPQARFHRIEHLEVALGHAFAGSADSFDDVQIATRGRDGASAYGHLQGNGTDQLRSPFLLLQSAQPSAGKLALPGRFAGGDADLDGLLLIGRDDREDDWAWPVRSAEDAAFAPTRGGADLQTLFGAEFLYDCARFTAGDVDGDGVEEALVVFGAAACHGAPETQLAVVRVEGGVHVDDPVALDVTGSDGAAILAVDVDDDGDDDLLVAAAGSVTIFRGDPSSGLADVPDVISLPVSDPVLDLAPIARVATASGPRRIAILAGGSVLTLAGDRVAIAAAAPPGARGLRSSDVNGDGLGDVLVLGDDGLTVLLGVAAPPVGDSR